MHYPLNTIINKRAMKTELHSIDNKKELHYKSWSAKLLTMGVQPLIVMRDFTLQGLIWIKEGKGWIKEEKGIMDIERGFPLFEILRLWNQSLESFESRSLGVYVCLSPLLLTPFIGLRQLNFHMTSRLAQAFVLSAPLGFFLDLISAK